jgi:hypothetical protein
MAETKQVSSVRCETTSGIVGYHPSVREFAVHVFLSVSPGVSEDMATKGNQLGFKLAPPHRQRLNAVATMRGNGSAMISERSPLDFEPSMWLVGSSSHSILPTTGACAYYFCHLVTLIFTTWLVTFFSAPVNEWSVRWQGEKEKKPGRPMPRGVAVQPGPFFVDPSRSCRGDFRRPLAELVPPSRLRHSHLIFDSQGKWNSSIR